MRYWGVVSGEGLRGLEHTACVLENKDGKTEEREEKNTENKNKWHERKEVVKESNGNLQTDENIKIEIKKDSSGRRKKQKKQK